MTTGIDDPLALLKGDSIAFYVIHVEYFYQILRLWNVN